MLVGMKRARSRDIPASTGDHDGLTVVSKLRHDYGDRVVEKGMRREKRRQEEKDAAVDIACTLAVMQLSALRSLPRFSAVDGLTAEEA